MLEYRPDQIKIVDFLLLAKFWACLLFFSPPSKLGDAGFDRKILTYLLKGGVSLLMVPLTGYRNGKIVDC